jgi:hypothetical protein
MMAEATGDEASPILGCDEGVAATRRAADFLDLKI